MSRAQLAMLERLQSRGVAVGVSGLIAAAVFDRERLPDGVPAPVISDVEAFEHVQEWIDEGAAAAADTAVDQLLSAIFGALDRSWVDSSESAVGYEPDSDAQSSQPDLEGLAHQVLRVAESRFDMHVANLADDVELPADDWGEFEHDLASATGIAGVSTEGMSTLGEMFHHLLFRVPPVPVSPYAGDRIDFVFSDIGVPPKAPVARTESGDHGFRPSCLGGEILRHVDDPSVARGRLVVMVNLVALGRCPRCAARLEPSPAGSLTTRCRCVPVCSRCRAAEEGRGPDVGLWPVEEPSLDDDELLAGAINALISPKSDATPPGDPMWRRWSYPTWPNRILGLMPPDGIRAMTRVGRTERGDKNAEIEERVLGCFLGGAVGDALGERVEFLSYEEIRQMMGPRGVEGYWDRSPHPGAFTDDTQMTLWTAEGLIRTQQRAVGSDYNWWSPQNVTQGSYQRWLLTQGFEPDSEHPVAQPEYLQTGWLATVRGLWSRMAPGNTCLSALRGGVPGTVESPVNDSKGCGGVMRVAPAGFVPYESFAFDLGCDLAALTHGHPSGYLASGALAHLIGLLGQGTPLPEAVDGTISRLQGEPGADECVAALRLAVDLASGERRSYHVVERQGGGWVAEEALGIAVYCALVAEDFRSGVLLAVNHGGDSDSTGSITGQILGSMLGVDAIPRQWLNGLQMGSVIDRVARDFVASFYDDRVFPIGLYPSW